MGEPTEEFGPYRVYEQLGVGGMASVHRAELFGIAGFRRTVALKRMLPHVAADEKLVRSFVREARLASHLHHANVAQTFELGRVGDVYFIAMELVTGRNLREVLRHCAAQNTPMPIPIALNILGQICDALDYAHDLCDETGQPLGIIHRDVSPSNIIVSADGIVKLIDFGIAKASAAGMQTLGGTIKGKFSYMSPEYIAGQIDARADLFALGVIAHELLSNRPLFQGRDDMDTLHRVRGMPIDPPSKFQPKVPFEIEAIVMTALERDPDKRWQKANALRTALQTETKRLNLVAMNDRVVDWIEWTFQEGDGAATKPRMARDVIADVAATGRAPVVPLRDSGRIVRAETAEPTDVGSPNVEERDARARLASPRPYALPEDVEDRVENERTTLRSGTNNEEPTGVARPSSQHAAVQPRRTSQAKAEPALPVPRKTSAQAAQVAVADTLLAPRPEPAVGRENLLMTARGAAPAPASVPAPLAVAKSAPVPAPLGVGKSAPMLAPPPASDEVSGVTTAPQPLSARAAVPAAGQPAPSVAATGAAAGAAAHGLSTLVLAILMLLAAAGTAAVVYFGLPLVM